MTALYKNYRIPLPNTIIHLLNRLGINITHTHVRVKGRSDTVQSEFNNQQNQYYGNQQLGANYALSNIRVM